MMWLGKWVGGLGGLGVLVCFSLRRRSSLPNLNNGCLQKEKPKEVGSNILSGLVGDESLSVENHTRQKRQGLTI